MICSASKEVSWCLCCVQGHACVPGLNSLFLSETPLPDINVNYPQPCLLPSHSPGLIMASLCARETWGTGQDRSLTPWHVCLSTLARGKNLLDVSLCVFCQPFFIFFKPTFHICYATMIGYTKMQKIFKSFFFCYSWIRLNMTSMHQSCCPCWLKSLKWPRS